MNKEIKFMRAVKKWNHKKNLQNFKEVYRLGFENNSILYHFHIWKTWRIFKNTYLNGRYKKIEKMLDN